MISAGASRKGATVCTGSTKQIEIKTL